MSVDSWLEALREEFLRKAATEQPTILHDGPAPQLTVRKATAYLPVSCCLLTDTTGVNHCTHPAPPPPSRWLRARWRMSDRWQHLRLHVGSWIAGADLRGED